MEYFDIRKMPVNLWRNGAGETREICCFPPATRDFHWRASIASIAANGEFSLFPGVERVITLLEGGEVTLEESNTFTHTLKQHQPFTFAGDKVVKAKLTEGQMSMDFNIMTRRDVCCSAAIFFAPKRDKFCTARRCQKDTFCTVQK